MISTNTERNILQETVPTKTAGHWFQTIWQKMGSVPTNTSENRFQPILIGSKKIGGKIIGSNQIGGKIIGSNQIGEKIIGSNQIGGKK